ncbi:MAG: hypothetical protein PVJ57_18980 [Phycisphaerae bacterium]|jgi:hypothetical protein
MEIENVQPLYERHGGFLWGLVGSVIGAAAGAAVWAAVAMLSNYELGIIAWLLGGLAGWGMAWGHHRGRVGAGLTAALIALLGILLARTVMLSYFFREDLAAAESTLALYERPAEQAEKIIQLAHDDATEESKREGRCPFDEQYMQTVAKAAAHYLALPEPELAKAYEEHQQWRREGRLEDRAWLEMALPSYFATEEHPEIFLDQEPMTPERWEACRHDAQTRAAALSADEQAATCRRLVQLWTVASHDCHRRLMESHAAFEDRPRELELFRQAYAEAKALSDDELGQRYLAAMNWDDEGQWEDPAWLRLRLAYIYAEDAWRQREMKSWIDSPTPGAAWDACIEDGLQRAAAVAEASLPDVVRREHSEIEHGSRQREMAVGRALLPFAPLILAVLGVQWIDIIFIGLAVFTAYRVATRRYRQAKAANLPDVP